MLILKRGENQAIVIGGNAVVRILGVKRGQVTLGIVAPESVSVDRQEVADRKIAEKTSGLRERRR
jgi:carbon storage regulator